MNWLPITGGSEWQRLILPAVALGYDGAAFLARLTRSSMLEVIRQDYMTTARAKGLHAPRVILRHGFWNAALPVLTLAGLQFGRLLGGTVVVEAVFARPGLGKLAIDAIPLSRLCPGEPDEASIESSSRVRAKWGRRTASSAVVALTYSPLCETVGPHRSSR